MHLRPCCIAQGRTANRPRSSNSIMLRALSVGAQGRRRGVGDIGVGLLAQAGNTYCAHDFTIHAYRRAASQCHDVGSDECRSAVINVVLDLGRRPLQPCSRLRLLDGEVRTCRADTIHPLEGKQISSGVNDGDRRGRIPPLSRLPRCLQDRLGSGLVESQFADGLCPDWQTEDRCQNSSANCKFHHRACRFDRWHLLSHLSWRLVTYLGRNEHHAHHT
jgi:hypothetical protein